MLVKVFIINEINFEVASCSIRERFFANNDLFLFTVQCQRRQLMSPLPPLATFVSLILFKWGQNIWDKLY